MSVAGYGAMGSVRKAGSLLLFIALPLAAAVSTVRAGERVDETRNVPRDAVITIENTRGDVDIIGWDEAAVSVAGELDDLAEAFIFEVDGRDVRIEVRMPRRDVNWGDGSDLKIQVPHESRVSFEGVSTDLVVESVRGGVRLHSVSGDIDVSDVEGEVMVKTVSGDVEVDDARGRARIASVSGDLELVMSVVDARVDSVSGDVEVQLREFDALFAETVSGELEVEGMLNPSGEIDLSSVSGDITLRLDPPVNATLRVRSGIGGDIYNDLNDVRPRDEFPSQQSLETTVGDGSGRIKITTVSADIRLN